MPPDNVQLTLALNGPPDYSRETFLIGSSNQHAFALVDAWPNWPTSAVVLVGPRGSGKSHLAAIWASIAGATLVIDPQTIKSDVPSSNVIIDNIRPDMVPERALFHLINATREAKTSLLLLSREEPAHWEIGLPDLESRLREATLLRLDAPDDALLKQLLVKLFADRQLIIDQNVVEYLIRRMERSFAAATDLVQLLDERALAEGRRVSRVLAASVLDEAQNPAET